MEGHLIRTHTTGDAVQVAELFMEPVFKLHGLPKIIISDRDPQCTSKFWKSVFKTLETQLRVTTAFHPETDGQTERLNQTLEIMLTHYVDERPSAWMKYLAIVEFAYNSTKHSATDRSPFSVVFGKDPDSPLTLSLGSNETQVQASASLLKSMHAAWADAKDCLSLAQTQQAQFSNDHRTPREFTPGDLVLLKRTPMKKNPQIGPAWIGPFQIESKNSAVTSRLKLPPGSRVHPVVYVGYLRPYESPAALQAAPDFKEDLCEYVEYAEFQEPEAILEKRVTRQGARYLVHWKNAPEHDNYCKHADEMMLPFPSIAESFEALQ